jgi:hypothetical protein
MNALRTPAIKNDRAVFLVVFILGMALCAWGGIGQAPAQGWLHPISIAGSVFGLLALLLGVSVLFRIRVAPITSDRAALIAMLGIIAVKIVLAALYRLFSF